MKWVEMEEQQNTAIRIRILCSIIARSAIDALEAHLREQGIPLSHLQFGLLHMVRDQALPLTELSRRFQRAPSTLVPALDGLEERGYIQRERDPADRRRIQILLTERGEEVLDSLWRAATDRDPVKQAIAQLDPAESAELASGLEELVRHLPEGEKALAVMEERMRALHSRT